MKKTDCICIGSLLKVHGIKGELSVQFEPRWISKKSFKKQKFLFAEIYNEDDLVPFLVETKEISPSGSGRIKFSDYDTSDDVKYLTNKKLFVPAELFSKNYLHNADPGSLTGYLAKDKKTGEIGVVDSILENSQQQTLVIKKDEMEILIPLVEEFILKIDQKEKILYMDIPEGLTNLNL